MNATEEAAFGKWWEMYRRWTWHQHVTSLGDATEPMPDSWKREGERDVLTGWMARAVNSREGEAPVQQEASQGPGQYVYLGVIGEREWLWDGKRWTSKAVNQAT